MNNAFREHISDDVQRDLVGAEGQGQASVQVMLHLHVQRQAQEEASQRS